MAFLPILPLFLYFSFFPLLLTFLLFFSFPLVFHDLVLYFAEDTKIATPESFFSIFHEFLSALDRATVANMAEKERARKAQLRNQNEAKKVVKRGAKDSAVDGAKNYNMGCKLLTRLYCCLLYCIGIVTCYFIMFIIILVLLHVTFILVLLLVTFILVLLLVTFILVLLLVTYGTLSCYFSYLYHYLSLSHTCIIVIFVSLSYLYHLMSCLSYLYHCHTCIITCHFPSLSFPFPSLLFPLSPF